MGFARNEKPGSARHQNFRTGALLPLFELEEEELLPELPFELLLLFPWDVLFLLPPLLKRSRRIFPELLTSFDRVEFLGALKVLLADPV